MKKTEFRNRVRETLKLEVEDVSAYQKTSIVRQCAVDSESEMEYDDSMTNKPWTDEQLRFILTTPPTKENCIRLAHAFKRGFGGIQQIFQWAATPKSKIDEMFQPGSFQHRVKRLAKEVGWVI